ncbi:hypothetical protein KPL70_014587 [Citrus sinensis]|nr:hypothetical protein KPL70_014587 [Citrus sinensis]
MMGWTADVLKNFEVPIVGFFTSDACSAAVECAMRQARIQDVKPGEARLLLGLPKDIALFESDLKRRPHGSLPVWGVGPLLPEQFYKSAGSVLRDCEMRTNRRSSNMTEDEIIQWLDLKSCGSVLYMSFGTEMGPTLNDYSTLANDLEASNPPII